MNLQEKVKFYAGCFESVKRDDKNIIILKNNAPTELLDAIQETHGNNLPNDYTYNWFDGILSNLQSYDIESIDDIKNYRAEIVERLVDVYTAGLTEWLASDINNVYYLTEAQEEHEEPDGFKLLMTAQYKSIDEAFESIIGLLESEEVMV